MRGTSARARGSNVHLSCTRDEACLAFKRPPPMTTPTTTTTLIDVCHGFVAETMKYHFTTITHARRATCSACMLCVLVFAVYRRACAVTFHKFRRRMCRVVPTEGRGSPEKSMVKMTNRTQLELLNLLAMLLVERRIQ